MQKIFEIKRTEAVNDLIKKYERYQKDYVVSDEESTMIANLQHLSEWDKVVCYALTEFRSIRKVAEFFGITHYKSRTAIGIVKTKLAMLQKRRSYDERY